jgi:hypothetical protein
MLDPVGRSMCGVLRLIWRFNLMPDFHKAIQERQDKTGESYAAARLAVLVERAPTLPQIPNPQLDKQAFEMARWNGLLYDLFNHHIPRKRVWSEPEEIARVLQRLGSAGIGNHTFMPDGGGFDLEGACASTEAGCVELHLDNFVYICRPQRLEFHNAGVEHRFFLLENGPLPASVNDMWRPEKAVSVEREDVLELDSGAYLPLSEEDRDDIRRHLIRYSGGSFAIFAKSCTYNYPLDGLFHLKMPSPDPDFDPTPVTANAYSAPQSVLGVERFVEEVGKLLPLLNNAAWYRDWSAAVDAYGYFLRNQLPLPVGRPALRSPQRRRSS